MSERYLCINKDEDGAFSVSLDDIFSGPGVSVNHLVPWSGGKETRVAWWALDADQLRSISRFFNDAADQCEEGKNDNEKGNS